MHDGRSSYLDGLVFGDDGFRGLDQSVFEGPLWTISSHGTTPLTAKFQVVHVIHKGWFLEMSDGTIGQMPCLLTSDALTKLVFHGPVSLSCITKSNELVEIVENGLPLVGKDWLGVVQYQSGKFVLDAFSRIGWNATEAHETYCPEWFDNLDETPQEDRFVVSPVSAVS